MKKAVIFDMDGTLWDSSPVIKDCWNKLGQKIFGPEFHLSLEDIRSQMGKTMDDILKSVAPKTVTKEQIKEFGGTFLEYELNYIKDGHPGTLYPHEEEVFSKLTDMGYGVYIVSNCQKGYIEAYLKAYPGCAKYVRGILCWGDTGLPKRGTIRQIISDHRIDKAVYVGDTSFDEIETRGANLPFIFASYGFGTPIAPDETIYSLEELPNKVKKYLEEN